MKPFYFYILLFSFLIIQNSCNKKPKEQFKFNNVDINKISSLVDLSDAEFGSISSFDIDSNGNYIVFDVDALKLKKFSPSGDLIHEVGEKGRGPGEFENDVTFLEIIDNEVYIFSTTKNTIKIFSDELVFKDELQFNKHISDIISLQKLALVDFFDPLFNTELILLNNDKTINDTIQYVQNINENPLYNMSILSNYDEDSFIISSVFRNDIRRIDLTGDEKWKVSLPNWPARSEQRSASIPRPKNIMVRSITSTNGLVFVLGGKYSKNDALEIHVIDGNSGTYLYSFKMPETSINIKAKGNYLYSINGKAQDITAWKVNLVN